MLVQHFFFVDKTGHIDKKLRSSCKEDKRNINITYNLTPEGYSEGVKKSWPFF